MKSQSTTSVRRVVAIESCKHKMIVLPSPMRGIELGKDLMVKCIGTASERHNTDSPTPERPITFTEYAKQIVFTQGRQSPKPGKLTLLEEHYLRHHPS